MAIPVRMPRQGQSVESCILTTWFAEVGDRVSRGDLLFAYETDKAAFEEEVRQDGVLLARFFEEGDEVPVLENVAVIGKRGEDVETFKPAGTRPGDEMAGIHGMEKQQSPAVMPPPDTGPLPDSEPPPERRDGLQKEQLPVDGILRDSLHTKDKAAISPRARRLAKEKRVFLEGIRGSGPGGRIIERDIMEAYRQGKRMTPLASRKLESGGVTFSGGGTTPNGRYTTGHLIEKDQADYRDVPLGNMRKIIAGAMFRSLQNSAQITHHMGANATGMLHLRNEVKNRLKEGYDHNITLNDMVCFAVIRALLKHPEANAHFLGDAVRIFHQVNLGLAVDTERGLMVPVLMNAGENRLPELSSRLKEMADLAKKGSISPDLLQPESATFTVSNLGNYGVEWFTPIINLPQVAILGVNAIVQRPVLMADGNTGFQPTVGLSLTYDHRAIDGGPATRFLAEIRDQVESISPRLLDS